MQREQKERGDKNLGQHVKVNSKKGYPLSGSQEVKQNALLYRFPLKLKGLTKIWEST